MGSRWGSADLPRYWITLDQEIIFDYPKQFANQAGEVKNYARDGYASYPHRTDISDISHLFREYIDTPVQELFTKHFAHDNWGLINILRAADRRIGTRRLDILRRRKGNKAAQKIIAKRQNKSRSEG